MLNINQWSLILAFRMGKRLNLLFNFPRRKTRSNKEAQNALMEDLTLTNCWWMRTPVDQRSTKRRMICS